MAKTGREKGPAESRKVDIVYWVPLTHFSFKDEARPHLKLVWLLLRVPSHEDKENGEPLSLKKQV